MVDATAGTSKTADTYSKCNTCNHPFTDRASQLAHYKSDWHVANLMRRIESLPPLESTIEPEFNAAYMSRIDEYSLSGDRDPIVEHNTVGTSITSTKQCGESKAAPEPFDPSTCLFCAQGSSNTDENLSHMRIIHGFSIPDQDSLIHTESFVSYLWASIMEINECLHCGTTRSTAKGIQQHMLTKGHCKISSIDDRPEYQEFYDCSTAYRNDIPQLRARETEHDGLQSDKSRYMYLASGRIIGDRYVSQACDRRQSPQLNSHGTHADRQEIRNADLSSVNKKEADEAQSKSGMSLVMGSRNQQGLIGVSEWQRRTLMATEKKMIRDEIRARNYYQAGLEKRWNKQEHFHADSPIDGRNLRY